jgi:hypothetical protein
MAMTVIGADEPALWDAVVARTHHDAYHLHAFHALAESRGEGRAQLFVYSEDQHLVAMPLLLRPVDVAGVGQTDLVDATSVHGYSGPICSDTEVPEHVRAGFINHLEEMLRERGVISAFSRLNPFLDQHHLLDGLGEVVQHGSTVAIDLAPTDEERRRSYRRDTRRSLRRLEAAGAEAHVDEGLERLDEFIELYEETMDRVDAAASNRLSPSDIRQLAHGMRDRMYHVVCMLGGVLVAAGLYTACRGIVQAHLGAARTTTLALAPARLEIEMAIMWARATGNRVMHLGGGLGASADSLFAFKRGFGRTVLPYYGWHLVLDEPAYHRLVDAAGANSDSRFFPAYRTPRLGGASIGGKT